MARPSKQKDALNAGIPLKPQHLSPQASIEWDRLVSEIKASCLQVTPTHRAAISLAATIAADIKSDWAEIQREGAYANSPKGGIMAHPAVKRMDALRRDYLKALSVIGLRPGQSQEAQSESLEDLLNG